MIEATNGITNKIVKGQKQRLRRPKWTLTAAATLAEEILLLCVSRLHVRSLLQTVIVGGIIHK